MMKILIKGAGDLASGIAYRLFKAGYSIAMTEIAKPTCVRRMVSFAEAVYEGEWTVEGIKAVYITRKLTDDDFASSSDYESLNKGQKYIFITSEKNIAFSPDVVVDARMAKVNLGTTLDEAPWVIGVGPGFTVGVDCHEIIETKRGHTLGRVIRSGSAIPNTGIPGEVGGYSVERLLKATAGGIFVPDVKIGDYVKNGQEVAYVLEPNGNRAPVKSHLDGIVRGMLHDDLEVTEGMKVGDVDARAEKNHCYTISDKALSVAGGVLESICEFEHHL